MLDGYFIDRTEVSNRDYKNFMDATGHPAPAYWDDHRFNLPDQPVTGVNWHDATAFCQWSNKRLPTEAEWEKAARGPEGYIYPWGNELNPKNANYNRSQEATSPVESHEEGKSAYGALNMAGNVFEWVSDWYDPSFYKNDQAGLNPTGPTGPVVIGTTGTFVDRIAAGSKKVIRGGSWFSPGKTLTSTHRFWNNPMNNSYGIGLGFRCAQSQEKDESLQARELYMKALIEMGDEKYPQALLALDKAIKSDPKNQEYLQLRDIIKKQVD